MFDELLREGIRWVCDDGLDGLCFCQQEILSGRYVCGEDLQTGSFERSCHLTGAGWGVPPQVNIPDLRQQRPRHPSRSRIFISWNPGIAAIALAHFLILLHFSAIGPPPQGLTPLCFYPPRLA